MDVVKSAAEEVQPIVLHAVVEVCFDHYKRIMRVRAKDLIEQFYRLDRRLQGALAGSGVEREIVTGDGDTVHFLAFGQVLMADGQGKVTRALAFETQPITVFLVGGTGGNHQIAAVVGQFQIDFIIRQIEYKVLAVI